MSDLECVERARQLRGSIRVPGDKSTSHRALMLSALASGESTITGLSPGRDVAATSAIIEQLGALRQDHDGVVHVVGPDSGLHAATSMLECGNSGTSMRLLAGVVATLDGVHHLVGDASLSSRPMDRIGVPLTRMGATVTGQGPNMTAPLEIIGTTSLRALDYEVPVPSAQVKSAILLAGLSADSATTLRETLRTRTTTETMLREAGVHVDERDDAMGRVITLLPSRPSRHDWFVPGDPSQAAFFAVLGAVHGDASLEVLHVESSRERVGFVAVLERMGARVRLVQRGNFDSIVSESSVLHATEIYSSEIPSVDEVPALTVAASAATGVSAFRQMKELRLKESDRFDGSMRLATSLGCRAWFEGDDFFIEGLSSSDQFHKFTLSANLDHRMAMAAAVAGAAGQGCVIEGASTVSSSYPHFFRDLALLQ
ncbi:MAG: 3-phosphoshikimate 1-carboxyvinyltransferase [Acidimicrobiales bacterium]